MTNEELEVAFQRADHLLGIYADAINEVCDAESYEIVMGHFGYWTDEYDRLLALKTALIEKSIKETTK